MKKLFISLLTLTSISAFAESYNCLVINELDEQIFVSFDLEGKTSDIVFKGSTEKYTLSIKKLMDTSEDNTSEEYGRVIELTINGVDGISSVYEGRPEFLFLSRSIYVAASDSFKTLDVNCYLEKK